MPSIAWAQLQLGQIQGNITNEDNGRPLQGVTIVVTGPALQGEQSEITDKNGQYLITQLPRPPHQIPISLTMNVLVFFCIGLGVLCALAVQFCIGF